MSTTISQLFDSGHKNIALAAVHGIISSDEGDYFYCEDKGNGEIDCQFTWDDHDLGDDYWLYVSEGLDLVALEEVAKEFNKTT